MLKVQEFLRNGGSLADLVADLGMKIVEHEKFPIVIINYDQIESPKMNPIVQECRGLVLEKDTWNIVMKGMPRFFNYGESLEVTDNFAWDQPFTSSTKEDGSLILVGEYKGNLLINTRGSFGNSVVSDICGKTWRELVLELLPRNFIYDMVNCECGVQWSGNTFIFELCTPWNKVVRAYPKNTLFLISVMNHQDENEIWEEVCLGDYTGKSTEWEGYGYDLDAVQQIYFKNLNEVEEYLSIKEKEDPTYEGLVLRDINGLRLKIKSKMYVSLHHMRGNNGENLTSMKNVLPWVMKGEIDEICTYFPEVREYAENLKKEVDALWFELGCVWRNCESITDQKEFALIAKNTKMSGILFDLKKKGLIGNIHNLTTAFNNADDLILKILKG